VVAMIAIEAPRDIGAAAERLRKVRCFSLTLAGVPAHDALSATLAYRLMSYWLPIPAGGLATSSSAADIRGGVLRDFRTGSACSPIRGHCRPEDSQAVHTDQEVHRWIRSSKGPGSWQGPS
jgi:hypothetical protein